MVMPERSFSYENYRWGFNGKETDNETNWQDYGFRIYYPGLAKFLSVDPLTQKFPWLTPFQFAANTPIMAIDVDGKEAEIVILGKTANGNATRTVFKISDYKLNEWKAIQSGFFGGYSHSEKTKGFQWYNGYKEYTLGMGTSSSNANGYTGPGVGTLTVDATGAITKLSFDSKSAKNLTSKSPSLKESLSIGAEAAYRLFINPQDAQEKAFNSSIKNVLAAGSLAFGGAAFATGQGGSLLVANMAGDIDQLVGYSDNIPNKELKATVKTVEFGVGLMSLKGDITEAFSAPKLDNIIQSTSGTCASIGDASEAVGAIQKLTKPKQ